MAFNATIAKVVVRSASFCLETTVIEPDRRLIIAFSADMAKLIFGCGYLGLRVAKLWLGRGETLYAVWRAREKARALQTQGIWPIVADLLAGPFLLPPDIETVLFAV